VPITSVDQAADTPAVLGLRHASVGTSALNTIRSSSGLILPIPPASGRSARSPAQWQGSSHRPSVSQSAARE